MREAINSSSVQTEVVKIGGLQTASISKEIDFAAGVLSGSLHHELWWFLEHRQELWEMRTSLRGGKPSKMRKETQIRGFQKLKCFED